MFRHYLKLIVVLSSPVEFKPSWSLLKKHQMCRSKHFLFFNFQERFAHMRRKSILIVTIPTVLVNCVLRTSWSLIFCRIGKYSQSTADYGLKFTERKVIKTWHKSRNDFVYIFGVRTTYFWFSVLFCFDAYLWLASWSSR